MEVELLGGKDGVKLDKRLETIIVQAPHKCCDNRGRSRQAAKDILAVCLSL